MPDVIKPSVSFEDFMKLDIRVATITAAEEVEGSEKLVKLTLSVGISEDEGTVLVRHVLAGIKKWYSPKDLINKKTIFLANLEPRKMMGMESQGMLMAVDSSDGEAVLIDIPDDVENGTQLQ